MESTEAQAILFDTSCEGKPFDEVYHAEWVEIKERRAKQLYIESTLPKFQHDAPPDNLVGLALSGGGIRSATFCLGLLQGLHKLRLLRIFDYLSTVSGGGYVGGWWSAWLARDELSSQIGDDFALLCTDDIKDPTNLVIKLRSGGDPISVSLREQFSTETRKLLASYKDRTTPSDTLIDAIVQELNLAIVNKHFSNLEHGEAGANKNGNEKGYRAQCLRFKPDSVWANRVRLEEAYPLEIKDIFPPKEKIEPERQERVECVAAPLAPGAARGAEAESSRNAWRDPIHHLRLYANYLTPRRGLLSADTWRAVSVITRNLMLTWLILLPVLTALILIGQMYFMIHPCTRSHFLNDNVAAENTTSDWGPAASAALKLCQPASVDEANMAVGMKAILLGRLIAMGQLIGALLGLIAIMALAWLLLSRDDSSITYWVTQLVCLGAVVTLVVAGINTIIPLSEVSAQLWNHSTMLFIWLGLATLLLLLIVIRQPTTKNAPYADRETNIRWKKEVWRNQISRIHTRLMVTAFAAFSVLLLAGFGHEIFHSLGKAGDFRLNLLSLVPVVSAIAGAIFTARRATPSGGGDVREVREPSALSRFIFAVTPGLVVVVLAVFISWLGHSLLNSLWRNQSLKVMQAVIVFYGISLCIALAIYEMKWRIFRLSWELIAFICLLIANIGWGVPALHAYIKSSKSSAIGFMLLYVSLFVAVAIGITALVKVFIKNQLRNVIVEKFRSVRADRNRNVVLRLIPLIVPVLVLASLLPWFVTSWKQGGNIPPYLQLELAVFAGSFILFRLSLSRSSEMPESFELRLFRNKLNGKSPESIWILAAGSLLLPIAISSWLHVFLAHAAGGVEKSENLILIFLPIMVAAFFGCLIMLRIVAGKLRTKMKSETPPPKPGALERLITSVSSNEQHLNPLKVVVVSIIGLLIFAGSATHNLGSIFVSQQRSALPINYPSIIFAIIASTILFTVSSPQAVSDGAMPQQFKWFDERLNSNGRQRLLWILISVCVALGLVVGFMADIGLRHITQETPTSSGILTAAVLPGMVACFTLTLFEMRWGEASNRRSLWLLTSAYVTLAALFIIGSLDSPESDLFKQLLTVLGLLAAIMVWIVALGWMVDPNSVSMHQFYKARLVRAYLGASNIERRKQRKEITESTVDDDLPLTSLKNCRRGAPYHLINTTLNLVAGRDLATAQRSASSFTLSQLYCGSSRTSYRPTADYMEGQLTLGTAVAASGAAVSPSMGAKKPTAALAMLLTLLNVRLGFWAPTPNREHWRLSQPRLWPFYLLREFLSQTNDLSSYCYLTDGGHFDNTGLYSLIERGCRFVVLVDCGADPEPCFQDLGDAIRRCRIDFGAEINLNIEPYTSTSEKKPTPCSVEKKIAPGFVVGKIRYSRRHAELLHWQLPSRAYSREDKDSRTGIIIYFKPSLVKNATADVKQYGIENSHFPQQSTAHQWFDEAQFESYRRLGQSYAKEAFEKLKAVSQISNKSRISISDVEAIFVEARQKFDAHSSVSDNKMD